MRSAKRCRHCVLCLLYSAYLRLGSQNLTCNPATQQPWVVQSTLYTEQCVKFLNSSFELTTSLCWSTIPHLWYICLCRNHWEMVPEASCQAEPAHPGSSSHQAPGQEDKSQQVEGERTRRGTAGRKAWRLVLKPLLTPSIGRPTLENSYLIYDLLTLIRELMVVLTLWTNHSG